MSSLVPFVCLLSLVGAAEKPPLTVSVPARRAVELAPAPGLTIAFLFSDGLQVDLAGPEAEVSAAVLEVSPMHKPGLFLTRRLDGTRHKCAPVKEGPERWLTEAHDELATSRVKFSEGRHVNDGVRLEVPLRGVSAAETRELRVRLILRRSTVDFRLQLERPYALLPARAEMLRQYQKLGPTLLVEEPGTFHFKVVRVKKDVCGDSALVEEVFDEKAFITLAFPSPDWRLATAHGWVFAEKLDPGSTAGIGPLDLSKVEVRNLTFLGDPSSRSLTRLITTPGRATAVFTLGDFSGCFGASCGDPVNLREAHVTLEGGALSTKLVKPPPQP